jgi:hypothetical protein
LDVLIGFFLSKLSEKKANEFKSFERDFRASSGKLAAFVERAFCFVNCSQIALFEACLQVKDA